MREGGATRLFYFRKDLHPSLSIFKKTIPVNTFIYYFPFFPLIFLDINFLKKKNSQVIKDINRQSLTFDLKSVNQEKLNFLKRFSFWGNGGIFTG